jgi:hypothetical protein
MDLDSLRWYSWDQFWHMMIHVSGLITLIPIVSELYSLRWYSWDQNNYVMIQGSGLIPLIFMWIRTHYVDTHGINVVIWWSMDPDSLLWSSWDQHWYMMIHGSGPITLMLMGSYWYVMIHGSGRIALICIGSILMYDDPWIRTHYFDTHGINTDIWWSMDPDWWLWYSWDQCWYMMIHGSWLITLVLIGSTLIHDDPWIRSYYFDTHGISTDIWWSMDPDTLLWYSLDQYWYMMIHGSVLKTLIFM